MRSSLSQEPTERRRTTALTGEIMKNYFKDVRVVGNIGIPYTSMVTGSTGETVTVAEIFKLPARDNRYL